MNERCLISRRHLIIPDAQIKPGVDTTHIDWAAQAILDYLPDVVVVIGDWWDMASLNSHEIPGSAELEGHRIMADIECGNEAFARLIAPLQQEQLRRVVGKRKRYEPELHFITGNHEARITRITTQDPKWDGLLTLDALKTPGFERHKFLKIVEIDGIKYCMAPHHRVLTDDLRYVPLGDIRTGDSLLAFDEHSTSVARRYRTATVERVEMDKAPLFRVRLVSGRHFDVTADHRWLVRRYGSTAYQWQHTSELVPGVSHALKLFDEWEELFSKDIGWLAGLYDGEGCLSKPNAKQGGIHLSLAQREGVVLERARMILRRLGFSFTENQTGSVISLRVGGASAEKLRLLGLLRPERLIDKFKPEMLGRVQAPDGMGNDTIEAVEPLGEGEIVKIQTSTGTMIVDGYAHHNCHYFPNPFSGRPIGGTIVNRLNHIGSSFVQGHQQGFAYGTKQYPDCVKHGLVCGRFYSHHENYRPEDVQRVEWSGVVVLNQVRNGTYDLMPLSFEYLREKYG